MEKLSFYEALETLRGFWENGKIVPEKIDHMADAIRQHNTEDSSPLLYGETLEEVLSRTEIRA